MHSSFAPGAVVFRIEKEERKEEDDNSGYGRLELTHSLYLDGNSEREIEQNTIAICYVIDTYVRSIQIRTIKFPEETRRQRCVEQQIRCVATRFLSVTDIRT